MPRVKKTINKEDKVIKSSRSKRHSGKPKAHPESEILKRVQNDKRDSGQARLAGALAKRARMTRNSLALEFFDTKGKVAETVDLPKEIFGEKVNNTLIAQAVRVYLANQRRGTASTKTRGEVHGTTKKVWQQKGTGRARHGSRKAPIFVHGGIVFGPHPRDYSLKLSKKMRRLALFSALSSKLKKGQIKGIKGFEKLEPKTKIILSSLKNLGIADKLKKVTLVLPSTQKEFENIYRGAKNIKGLNIMLANLINTYEVLNSDLILLSRDGLKMIENVFLKGWEAKNE